MNAETPIIQTSSVPIQAVTHEKISTTSIRPIIVIDPKDFEDIYQLRFKAWQTRINMVEHFQNGKFLDQHDANAVHWAIKDNNVLVASARLNISYNWAELPYGDIIRDYLKKYKPPFFMLSRLVVAPSARKNGYSTLLDKERLRYILNYEQGTIFVVISSKFRIEKLLRYGFHLGSYLEALDTFPGGKSTLLALNHKNIECGDINE